MKSELRSLSSSYALRTILDLYMAMLHYAVDTDLQSLFCEVLGQVRYRHKIVRQSLKAVCCILMYYRFCSRY